MEELNKKNDALVGEIADREAIIAELMHAYVHPTSIHDLLAHQDISHYT
jgi:hypothetical protein